MDRDEFDDALSEAVRKSFDGLLFQKVDSHLIGEVTQTLNPLIREIAENRTGKDQFKVKVTEGDEPGSIKADISLSPEFCEGMTAGALRSIGCTTISDEIPDCAEYRNGSFHWVVADLVLRDSTGREAKVPMRSEGPDPAEYRPAGTGKNMGEALTDAVASEDIATLGRLVETMRFRFGLNYDQILSMAMRRCPGMTRPVWDQLMAEVDALESE